MSRNKVGTGRHRSVEWQPAARRYLERLAMEEWKAQGRPIPTKRGGKRYSPSEYHRQLVELLGKNDEEGFKALKMLQGYSSAVGV